MDGTKNARFDIMLVKSRLTRRHAGKDDLEFKM